MPLRCTWRCLLPLRCACLLLLLLPWWRSALLQPLWWWGTCRLSLRLPLPRHCCAWRWRLGLCLLRWRGALLRLRHEPLRRRMRLPVPLLLLLAEGPHALQVLRRGYPQLLRARQPRGPCAVHGGRSCGRQGGRYHRVRAAAATLPLLAAAGLLPRVACRRRCPHATQITRSCYGGVPAAVVNSGVGHWLLGTIRAVWAVCEARNTVTGEQTTGSEAVLVAQALPPTMHAHADQSRTFHSKSTYSTAPAIKHAQWWREPPVLHRLCARSLSECPGRPASCAPCTESAQCRNSASRQPAVSQAVGGGRQRWQRQTAARPAACAGPPSSAAPCRWARRGW